MTPEELWKGVLELARDLDTLQELRASRPFMAHYTSIESLESIMKSGELWFSNPLMMNDLEEVRFGILQGKFLFEQNQDLDEACGTRERTNKVRAYFQHYFQEFEQNHLFDTCVFCFSEHDLAKTDGLLSMWRGYGGLGKGAALIFNTDFVPPPQPESPILIGKVFYGTAQARTDWLSARLKGWCDFVRGANVGDEQLYVVTRALFELIKFFALLSKHDGFSDEREWRLVYLPERDVKEILKPRINYHLGHRGLEPRLKFEIKPLPLDSAQTWTFETILHQIILGPSVSSEFAQRSVKRMLEIVKRPQFVDRVIASTIPLRPAS